MLARLQSQQIKVISKALAEVITAERHISFGANLALTSLTIPVKKIVAVVIGPMKMLVRQLAEMKISIDFFQEIGKLSFVVSNNSKH